MKTLRFLIYVSQAFRWPGWLVWRGQERAGRAFFVAICVLTGLILSACTSSMSQTDALATEVAAKIYATQTAEAAKIALVTQVAASIFATQTAGAPPSTPTFTSTPSPSPSPTFTHTPTSTPTPTATSTPTFTSSPTMTSMPTLAATPTPVPDAVVKAKVGNLRAGPGTNYRVIGKVSQGQKVDFLSKSPGGNWVRVSITKGDKKVIGWLWVKLLIIYTPLKTVVVEANIPPTPTPRATPTPKPTPLPRVCPANATYVKYANDTDETLTLKLVGPIIATVIIPPNSYKNICLWPGGYDETATIPGEKYQDTDEYEEGEFSCSTFYVSALPYHLPFLGSCDASTNPSDYQLPEMYHLNTESQGSSASHPGEKVTYTVVSCNAPNSKISDVRKVGGQWYIYGTATYPNLWYWKVEASADNGEHWMHLFRSEEPVTNGLLVRLDLSTVPRTKLLIRLMVVDKTGNYPEPCTIRAPR